MPLDKETYDQQFSAAANAYDTGDITTAFQNIRGLLSYPESPELDWRWAPTWNLFAAIGGEFAGKDFTQLAQHVALYPNNANILYRMGYELVEKSLPQIAATVLTRAQQLSPDNPRIIEELAVALERSHFHTEACRLLRSQPTLLEKYFLLRYLLVFNTIMLGDLAAVRQRLPLNPGNDREQTMAQNLEDMVTRADCISTASPLDTQDLRGWHFALTRGLLLHRSPYGLDAGMYGRYAYIQDSYSLIHEGIQRLKLVLDIWQFPLNRIIMLPDRSSQILAHAVAQAFHCDLAPWTDTPADRTGLVVAYDLNDISDVTFQHLSTVRPNQLFWTHASCWTQDQPYAADLTTFLYQFNTNPWSGQGMRRSDSGEPVKQAVDERAAPAIAADILNAPLRTDALCDRTDLETLASALWPRLQQMQQTQSLRCRQWNGSPVRSSQFT
ncbi:MAG: hypothetical protein AAFU71_08875 [Cyanobacteria bacterium J06632_22]